MHHIRSFSVDNALFALETADVQPVSLSDPEYPPLLREIHDPPYFLFVQGRLRTDIPLVAVVGTRHPTPYGVSCTKTMTSTLVASGFGIVSGLAHGVDSAAHQEALRAQGYTIAVVAHGHGTSTPREHALAQHILAGGGAIVSEHLPHVHAQKHYFPIRNRIIAGMAKATLITEASLKSGTLITASCALRENRDVFAVPGLITNPHAEGPHALISDGAACIHSPASLREALGLTAAPTQSALPLLSEDEDLFFRAIQESPKHLDDLLEISGVSLQKVVHTLNALKSKGYVEERPGNVYAAIKSP